MRQFDNRNSWLDDKGNPLVGRVKFCRLHTTELQNIYNINGTVPLANPQYTNNIGQLVRQVFLSDVDYSIRFEKYIGNARMEDDDDPTNWLFVYSADNLYDTFDIDVDSVNLQSVNTIADLRNTDPSTVVQSTGIRIIELQGYTNPGDKPSVRYVWNEYSVDSDNGGSVIKVNGIATGRWELVNDFNYVTGVDVRHFGVFGKDTLAQVEPTMAAKIDIANTYAMGIGSPLYFPNNDGDLTWFKIQGNLNGAIFAKNTRIVATNDCTVNVTDENSYLDVYNDVNNNKYVTITGEVVKSSWAKNANRAILSPSYKLIIDETLAIITSNRLWSDLIVDILVPVSDCQFTNCILNSVNKLALNNSFHNCVLKQAMFAYTFTATVFDDDTIEIEDWPNTSSWLYLVTQNTAKPLDFKGRVVDSTCSVGWGVCSYKNAVFSNYTCTQSEAYFDNCSGTINITNPSLKLFPINSTLNFTTPQTAITLLNTNNSTLSFGKNLTFSQIYGTDATFNDPNYTYTFTSQNSFNGCNFNVGVTTTTVVMNKCSIFKPVTCTEPSITECVLSAPVYQNPTTSNVNFIFLNNTFLEGSSHYVTPTIPNSIFVGSWIGNRSTCSYHFIGIDRTNVNLSEAAHSYIYTGNTGVNTLQRDKAFATKVINYMNDYGLAPTVKDGNLIFTYNGTPYESEATTSEYTLVDFQMFSVGTQDLGEITLQVIPTSFIVMPGMNPSKVGLNWYLKKIILTDQERTRSEWLSQQTYTMVRKGYMFKGGYTFGVTYAREFAETSTWIDLAAAAIATNNTTKFIIEKY